MKMWRKIGVVIIFGVVAIIAGGLAWALSKDWAVVFTILGIVGFSLLAIICNPEQVVNQILGEKERGEHE